MAPACLSKEYSNGGRVEIMDGYAKKSDRHDLRTIAREWAMAGKVVQITTAVHYKDPRYGQVFGKLTGTKYERKRPDLIVDGVFYEYESYTPPFNKGKIKRMLNHGFLQSSKIIVDNTKGSSDRYIRKLIHDRIKLNHLIEEVWLYEKGSIRLLYKKQ